MRLWSKTAILLAFLPLVASAQYRDLDTALSNLNRGFGSGDSQAIVSGIAGGDKVQLAFPGLIDQSGNTFYGREQAGYLLDSLFGKVHPSGFEQESARKESSAGQYHITGTWTIQNAGKAESRELYMTLQQNKNGSWSVLSVRSAGK
ncbi:MAG TPA: hypothetical protein VL284_14410 [Thermoanaerobaculia bacterium]|nr:hypothetical protein [Thermoanaerobaculia bacterium]